jgi:glutamate-5-semialdehyde dehydrogenase
MNQTAPLSPADPEALVTGLAKAARIAQRQLAAMPSEARAAAKAAPEDRPAAPQADDEDVDAAILELCGVQ